MLPLLEKRTDDPVKTLHLCFQFSSVIAALPSMKQDSPDCFRCVLLQVRVPVVTLFAPCLFRGTHMLYISILH